MTTQNLPDPERLAAKKAAMWQQISNLLREYELAQIETAKTEIAKSYDSLRQKMQVVALESELPEETES